MELLGWPLLELETSDTLASLLLRRWDEVNLGVVWLVIGKNKQTLPLALFFYGGDVSFTLVLAGGFEVNFCLAIQI